MSLSRDDVAKVALLARLQFSDEELDTMTKQLGQIVEYIDQLSELNTDGVQPMAHAADITNVFADDVLHASLPRERALQNAPKHDGEYYRVPPVLGE